MNRFQNKPQASKIRGLQKVGFLGIMVKNFASDIFFIYWKLSGILESLRSSAESVRGVT